MNRMSLKHTSLTFAALLLLSIAAQATFAEDAFDLGPLPELPIPTYLADAPTTPPPPSSPPTRLRSYELPPVNVVGQRPSDLREEDRVGSYGQPRWTATRRFPNTRVYVVPEGKIEGELWFIPRFLKSGETNGRYLAEIEYGLPHRFQIDAYYRLDINEAGDGQNGAQFEVRWALADWGKIPLNPTLYVEYIAHEDDPDGVEFKLLFGDELAPRIHWGINLVGEFETGGSREYTYEIDGGISYTLVDEKFSVGAETKIEFNSTHGDRSNYETSILVGPSVQWRPIPRLSVNLAPLFGVTPDSATARVYLNIGWEF
jgi:hypothetical protein